MIEPRFYGKMWGNQNAKFNHFGRVRDPKKTAEAMFRMIEIGIDGRSKLGISGRDYVYANYNMDKIFLRYEKVFNGLVAHKE